jgi:hypothetical protein
MKGIAMRWIALTVLLSPTTLYAQEAIDPSLSRATPNTEAIISTLRAVQADRPSTLASGVKKQDALVSKNEGYNLGRAASGRVGIRVGNDMSFPIGK